MSAIARGTHSAEEIAITSQHPDLIPEAVRRLKDGELPPKMDPSEHNEFHMYVFLIKEGRFDELQERGVVRYPHFIPAAERLAHAQMAREANLKAGESTEEPKRDPAKDAAQFTWTPDIGVQKAFPSWTLGRRKPNEPDRVYRNRIRGHWKSGLLPIECLRDNGIRQGEEMAYD
jgi:hypothetical protein